MSGSRPSSTRPIHRWLGAAAATLGCLVVGLFMVDLGTSGAMLAAADPALWATAIMLSMLMAAFRAIRLVASARARQPWPIVKASLIHNAANAVLPAKVGEAALPIALSRYAGFDPVRGIGLLVLVRLCDLVALAGLGLWLVAILDVWSLPTGWRVAIAIGGGLMTLGVVVLPRFIGAGAGRLRHVFNRLGPRLEAAASHLTDVPGLALVTSTACIWVALVLAAQVCVAAVGLTAEPGMVALACVAASLAFALPIGGIANAGPFEAAFAGVLVTGGAATEPAVAAAILLHLCAIVGALLPAGVALAFPVEPKERGRCL
jgi:uncharacterized membrane protein YbhN (UPF0104 family)